jgi:hypothetical protein
MNKRLFNAIVFLVSLCLIVSQSYACPLLIAIIQHPDPKFFGKDMPAGFYGGSSIGSIDYCLWSLPPEAGHYDVVYYSWNYINDEVNCKFHYPGGPYDVNMIVTDYEGRRDNEIHTFYVMEADLDIDGVDDDDEENPGGYVSLNDDDDNNNGIPDMDDETITVNGEDNLVEISLSVSPSVSTGTMTLAFYHTYLTGLRVWNSPTMGDGNMIIPNGDPPNVRYYEEWDLSQESMPPTLYVEGWSTSGPRFDKVSLTYSKNGSFHTDTVNFTVVKLEVSTDSSYTNPLDDWPKDGDQLRSPKYIFGEDDPIYVQVDNLGTDPQIAEPISDFVKVTSESDVSGIIKLNVKETGVATQIFRNSEAGGELLYLSTASSEGAGDKIEVIDEEELTFWLEIQPDSDNYVTCKTVMVDRGEYAMATQKPDSGGWFYDVAEDFEGPLSAYFKWWPNGDVKGPTEDFIRDGGTNSQCDIMSIAGHGLPAYESVFSSIKLNGTDYELGDDGYCISPHEDSSGIYVGHKYFDEDDEWKLDTYPPGTPTTGGIEDSWNTDMEWVILSACHLLRNDTPGSPEDGDTIYNKDVWDDTLRGGTGRPAHGLFGYSGSPSLYDIDEVVSAFLNCAMEGATLVSAWKYAVIAESWTNYGIVMHADNENDKLTKPTADTKSTAMKYWYSAGLFDQSPISYTDIGLIASERRKSYHVDVNVEFNPSGNNRSLRYLSARMEHVFLDGIRGVRTPNGLQIFRYDKRKKVALGKRSNAAEIARTIDARFSKEANIATCFEEAFNADTQKVTSSAAVGKVHEFSYDNPAFPIARSKKGNFVRVMTEHGEPVLVVARFMKPLGYLLSDELMISQRDAVEKVKAKLQETNRFGKKCRITKVTLEYEDVGRAKPDGTIELAPVWQVNVESEKAAVRVYVPACEMNQ